MKRLCILIILMIAGCSWTPQQHAAFQRAMNDYSIQQQNLAYQQNMQLRENGREINRQLQRQPDSNYWQEARARQEYNKEQNNYYKRMRHGILE